jgi:hypothetical protein
LVRVRVRTWLPLTQPSLLRELGYCDLAAEELDAQQRPGGFRARVMVRVRARWLSSP